MLLGASSVYANGTDAGTVIQNSATLSYSAGGVQQADVNTTQADSFVVDKKIDMVMTTTDANHIAVDPGATQKETHFEFKNEGNSAENFKFELSQMNGGNSDNANDGTTLTDNKDTKTSSPAPKVQYSTDNGNTWTDLPADGIVNLSKDQTIQLKVIVDIPANVANNDVMNVKLEATAYKDDKSAAESETGGSDTQGAVDIVFADGAAVQNGATTDLGVTGGGVADTAKDGKDAAVSGYVVATPVLSIVKTSCVVSDPVNNTTNPKRIPGAVIRYMFDITNSGSTDASGVKITDNINSNLDTANTKTSAKKDEGKDSCSCATAPATDISADASVDANNKLEINNIGVPHTAPNNHTCVSVETEIK